MKDMEREKFEGSWNDAFENAEITPSDKVWANIELDLEKAKGGDLKKRLFFYQMLAAASVVFAMGIGGIGYYYSFHAERTGASNVAQYAPKTNQPPAQQPLLNDAGRETDSTSVDDGRTDSRNVPVDDGAQRRAFNNGNTNNSSRARDAFHQGSHEPAPGERNFNALPTSKSSDNSETLIAQTTQQSIGDLPLVIKDRAPEPLHTPREVHLNFEELKQEVDPVVAMMARLAQRERELQDEDSRKEDQRDTDENLWTSIGFAAGSFNTVQGSTAGPSASRNLAFAMAAPIVEQESKANGYSYSMGINVGTRLSERWVFQGGVNYLTQASEYISNNIVMDAPGGYLTQQKFRVPSTNELMMTDASDLRQKLVYSAPYSINNSMRYLSIPMQAGYQLINKTFGLQLNAGVATDLFLQNTISAESDQIAKTSQPVGADSPYRAVNLSGLFGTEVSYRFSDRYRVSLNPGIRYPFNTIYKSELGVQSSPLTFDVGLRFRYIFK